MTFATATRDRLRAVPCGKYLHDCNGRDCGCDSCLECGHPYMLAITPDPGADDEDEDES